MLRFLLGLDETQDAVGISVFFRTSWIVALVLIAAALAFAVYLYRREQGVSGGWRRFLSICQAVTLLILVVLVLQPVAEFQLAQTQRSTILILIDTSESMATQDRRQTVEERLEVARLQQKVPLGNNAGSESDEPTGELSPVSRLELAKLAMEHPQINLVARLAERFDVRFFTFDDRLRPQREEATTDKQPDAAATPAPLAWLQTQKAEGKTSQIGSAIDDAVARHAGQPVAGVIVLSDFGWIKGKDPVTIARELKQRDIPVFPVVIGLPSPPDIHLRSIIAPDVVFEGDHVPLRVQIDSKGYEGRTVTLNFAIDGDAQSAITRQIELNGDLQFEQLMFTPEKEGGSVQLSFTIAPEDGEASSENNQITHTVRIIDEKIKVLYIEGMPRWEYRYLRWVLLRDPRLEVQFLMTQGDPELAKTSSQYLPAFPQDAKDAFKYDLVILGDVPATYFNNEQSRLIDELVRKSGGSLLMVAGPMAAPSSYRDTPIGELLPVNLGSGQWQFIDDHLHPVVTPAGRESRSVLLGDTDEATDRIWSRVKPLHSLPPLVGAKPGATVLLSLPSESTEIRGYPLVTWQRVGGGKSMFVATEDLWRMRLEVGSRHHARFWGQTIQFLTLSRLLGQNKQIALETDRATYGSGEQVSLFANVLTESFEPVEQASFVVTVGRDSEPGSAVSIELTPVPDSPGLYSGEYLAGDEGAYKLATLPQDAEISNTVEFGVANLPLEKRETSARRDVAEQIAAVHGRTVMSLTDLAELPVALKGSEPITVLIRRERDLWDIPLLFILLVIVAGLEWYVRRRHNLV